MIRLALFGVALSAAVAVPVAAQDTGEQERAFARAARSFTACLAGPLDSQIPVTARGAGVQASSICLIQESAYRDANVRLRVSRGQAPDQAANDTEADIRQGRRMLASEAANRYALAR